MKNPIKGVIRSEFYVGSFRTATFHWCVVVGSWIQFPTSERKIHWGRPLSAIMYKNSFGWKVFLVMPNSSGRWVYVSPKGNPAPKSGAILRILPAQLLRRFRGSFGMLWPFVDSSRCRHSSAETPLRGSAANRGLVWRPPGTVWAPVFGAAWSSWCATWPRARDGGPGCRGWQRARDWRLRSSRPPGQKTWKRPREIPGKEGRNCREIMQEVLDVF